MGLELGTKIRQLRKFSGMTQEQLAEKLHVSRQALSKWENDTSLPDLESVIKISTLFRISLEELLLEEKEAEESFAVKRHTACDDRYYDGGVCLRAQEYYVEYGLYFVQIYRDRTVCGGVGQLFPASASCSRSGSCRYCAVYILFYKEQEKLRKDQKE